MISQDWVSGDQWRISVQSGALSPAPGNYYAWTLFSFSYFMEIEEKAEKETKLKIGSKYTVIMKNNITFSEQLGNWGPEAPHWQYN